MYERVAREENPAIPPAVTLQGFTPGVSPQLKAISPLVAGDITRYPPQASLPRAYSQDAPHTDIWGAGDNYDIPVSSASPAYAQTSQVDRVARVDDSGLSHHRYIAENASPTQPEALVQGYSPNWQTYSPSSSQSPQSASTSSSSEVRHQQNETVVNTIPPLFSVSSTYSALQGAVSFAGHFVVNPYHVDTRSG